MIADDIYVVLEMFKSEYEIEDEELFYDLIQFHWDYFVKLIDDDTTLQINVNKLGRFKVSEKRVDYLLEKMNRFSKVKEYEKNKKVTGDTIQKCLNIKKAIKERDELKKAIYEKKSDYITKQKSKIKKD